jgi:protein TonB
MRIRLLLFLLFACCFQSQAQQQSVTPDTTNRPAQVPYDGEQVYTYVGEMPKFQGGGEEAFVKYIQENIVYPSDARQKGISGTSWVQYIIEKDGSVSNVKIVSGKALYPSLDAAAMTVVYNSPKWEPGKNNGVPVAVKKIARIKFILPQEE